MVGGLFSWANLMQGRKPKPTTLKFIEGNPGDARRAQEALRVLEDLAKLVEISPYMDSNKFRRARFEMYTLEKELVSRLVAYE